MVVMIFFLMSCQNQGVGVFFLGGNGVAMTWVATMFDDWSQMEGYDCFFSLLAIMPYMMTSSKNLGSGGFLVV